MLLSNLYKTAQTATPPMEEVALAANNALRVTEKVGLLVIKPQSTVVVIAIIALNADVMFRHRIATTNVPHAMVREQLQQFVNIQMIV